MDQKKVGRFIAECRKEKGITQAQLAEQFGISNKAVSNWETGKSLPDATIMIELSNYLGITVNELLAGGRIEMEEYKDTAEQTIVDVQMGKEKLEKKYSSIIMVMAGVFFWLAVSGLLLYGYCLKNSDRLDSNINILFEEISHSIRQGEDTNGLLNRMYYSEQNKNITSVDDMVTFNACVSQVTIEDDEQRIGEKVDEFSNDAVVKKYSTRKVVEDYIGLGDSSYYLEIEYGYNILNYVLIKTNYWVLSFTMLLIIVLWIISNMQHFTHVKSLRKK